VAVCWDQWFPKRRAMAPWVRRSSIRPQRFEPHDPSITSKDHWQRTMRHVANVMPVVASNRIGVEKGERFEMTFYGHSFIAGKTGEIVAEADHATEQVIVASFDLEAIRAYRHAWGLFRDRRPDLYQALLTLDGGKPVDG
jgi:N-carbamoylputrescine amidase